MGRNQVVRPLPSASSPWSTRRRVSVFLSLVIVAAVTPVRAQTASGWVNYAKKATVQILVSQNVPLGSGFILCPGDWILTAAHVSLEDQLVRQTGAPTAVRMRRFKQDTRLDVAIIAANLSGTSCLRLGESGKLSGELDPIVAVHYPFQSEVTTEEPSATPGTISRLRVSFAETCRSGCLELGVQLDKSSSGGPVLNATGEVVGMIVAGVRGTSYSFALPADSIKPFLDQSAGHVVGDNR